MSLEGPKYALQKGQGKSTGDPAYRGNKDTTLDRLKTWKRKSGDMTREGSSPTAFSVFPELTVTPKGFYCVVEAHACPSDSKCEPLLGVVGADQHSNMGC